MRARTPPPRQSGSGTIGLAVDLSEPETIADALSSVPSVDDLVIAAIERDANTLANYDIAAAIRLVTLKLVGYTAAVHALRDRLTPGGVDRAVRRPRDAASLSRIDHRVDGQRRRLGYRQLIDDGTGARFASTPFTPASSATARTGETRTPASSLSRTPLGRLVTMDEIVDAVEFLLDNTGVNGVNLAVDGGWLLK